MKKNIVMFLLIVISAPLFSKPHTSQRDAAFWRLRGYQQKTKFSNKARGRYSLRSECKRLQGLSARRAMAMWATR